MISAQSLYYVTWIRVHPNRDYLLTARQCAVRVCSAASGLDSTCSNEGVLDALRFVRINLLFNLKGENTWKWTTLESENLT